MEKVFEIILCRVLNGCVENLYLKVHNVAALNVQKNDTIEITIMRAAIC